jgi:hypothetical protein
MSWEFKCPTGWYVFQRWGDGYTCLQKTGGLRVIIDCEVKSDGKEWIHVSVSRKSWTPSHEDMALVKRDFIGDLYAYSVWPPREVYVNIHNHCLHLWALADGSDGRVLPEFSEVIEGIGRSV